MKNKRVKIRGWVIDVILDFLSLMIFAVLMIEMYLFLY